MYMKEQRTEAFISVEIGGDVATIVEADVDIAGGPILEAALLQREDDRPLVVDLGGVSFIDSSGLRSLLAASLRAHQRDTSLLLRNVGPEVWRLLEITSTASSSQSRVAVRNGDSSGRS
jgi:anti-sigma B factor antagonist